jgi:hypothetical protein
LNDEGIVSDNNLRTGLLHNYRDDPGASEIRCFLQRFCRLEELNIEMSNALKAKNSTGVAELKKLIAALEGSNMLTAASPTALAEGMGEQAQANELMSVEKKQDAMQKNEDFTRAMMQAMEERTEKAEERAEKAEDGGKQMRFQERAEAEMKRVKEDEAESLKRVKEDEAESDRRQQDDFNR